MMATPNSNARYERDRLVWDECADVYESRIVKGHPEVLAYEAFEEDLLDLILLFLARDKRYRLRLIDLGCGSARLHLRYGIKTVLCSALDGRDRRVLEHLRRLRPDLAFDPLLAEHLVSVLGIDFAKSMLAIAREKLTNAGLASQLETRLELRCGSAFDLQPLDSEPLPVVVCVCNSIGVMQGPEGAAQLFAAVERAVGSCGGIGIISAYQQGAVQSHALGNYESTMDVCGQPRWLLPDTYAGPEFRQIPKRYKRAHDTDETLTVEVRDANNQLVVPDHVLRRSAPEVEETLRSGRILTHTNYESHWYSFAQFDAWIGRHWGTHHALHLRGSRLDALRAEPVQLAILDTAHHLTPLFDRLITAKA